MVNESKSKFIDAARKVIARLGVNNATVQSIVDEAGSSKGALYHYYNSKNDILYDVMDQSLNKSTQVTQQLNSAEFSIEQVYESICEGMTELFQKKKDESRVQFYLAHEAMLGNEEIQVKFNDKYGEWIDQVEQTMLILYGSENTLLNRAMAATFIAAVDGLVMQNLMGVKAVSPREIRELWNFMLKEGIPGVKNQLAAKVPE
jgi:AcrR family transcriptional regulator